MKIFNDGDTVIIRQQNTAENGQRVVALIDQDSVTLKKFYREKNKIRLQPANKNISPPFYFSCSSNYSRNSRRGHQIY